MSNYKASPLMEEVRQGRTKDYDGVPLGLINYMVHTREPRQQHVRIGNRVGTLHFVTKLPLSGLNLRIFNDADWWVDVYGDKLRLS